MKQEQIKTLIDALAASDLAELEYTEDGSTLRLVKRSALATAPTARRPAAVRKAPAAGPPEPAPSAGARAAGPPPPSPVWAPRPAPRGAPFVQPGQAVEAGQMLCVIEAMKMFNEVRADAAATVQAVLVHSGQEVEAGEPLFRFG